ncbi:hypothetical protein U728_1563 [Clostridium botulinum 202F]|nr:hypothetical protein U728_1563 [Clostridium botulinum 202F]
MIKTTNSYQKMVQMIVAIENIVNSVKTFLRNNSS